MVGVEMGEPVDAELQRVLHGYESFLGWDLVDEASHKGGLPGPGASGDDDVEASENHCLEEMQQGL